MGSGDSEGSEDSEGVAGDEGKEEKDGASSDPERDEGVVSYQTFQSFDALLGQETSNALYWPPSESPVIGKFSLIILAKSFCKY